MRQALLCTFSALLWTSLVYSDLNPQKAGPYDLVDVSMQHCDDEGTQDFSYTLKTKKVSRTAFSFAMNITMNKYDFGDDLDMFCTLDQFTNGGWKSEYFQKSSHGLCKNLQLYVPELFKNVVGKFGNGTCPLPPGFYQVPETSLANFKIHNIPVFFYNKYRANLNILAKDVKIGCVRLLMTAIPKKKKPK